MYLNLKYYTNLKALYECFCVIFLAGFMLLFSHNRMVAQGTQVEFGQNRVEYKHLEWSFYDKEDYRVYFYLGGQDLGKFVIDIAEKQFDYIEKVLEYKLDEQVQILVFTDLNDIYQTNIDFNSKAGGNYNSGGKTKIVKGRLFLYFNGNHADLELQLKEGIAALFIHDMLVGGDLQDMIQYSVVMNFPDWYVRGLVAYFGEAWSMQLDNKMRDYFLNKKKIKFTRLSVDDPEFAGLSFWNFIDHVYGHEALINLLYLVRVNKSIESGFQFITGKSKKEIYKQWEQYYRGGYKKGQEQKEIIDPKDRVGRKLKKRFEYYGLKVGPEEKHLAYVRNFLGRYHLRIMDIEKGKSKTILRGGFKSFTRILDRSFPLLDWNSDGEELTAIFEKKDKIYLLQYNLEEKEKEIIKIEKFQKINDFSYANNDETLVMSANKKGKSDLFYFNIPSHRVTKITNDIYDDLQANYMTVDGKRGIAFVSNRPNDTLNTKMSNKETLNHFNLFFYELKQDGNRIIQLTNDSSTFPRSPQYFNREKISYLSNENGIYNQYVVRFDSTFLRNDTIVFFKDSVKVNPIITDLNRPFIDSNQVVPVYQQRGVSSPISNRGSSILEFDMARTSGEFYDLHLNKGRYQISKRPFLQNLNQDTLYPGFISDMVVNEFEDEEFEDEEIEAHVESQDEENFSEEEGKTYDSYSFETRFDTVAVEEVEEFTFQTPFDDWAEEVKDLNVDQKEEKKEKRSYLDILRNDKEYKRSKIQPYQIQISLQSLTTQMDNSIMFSPYTSDPSNPSLTPFIRATLTDLFEDHVITGGMKIPTRLNSGEYFVSYENRKKRLDKRVIVYRKSDLESFGNANAEQFYRISNHIIEGRVLWPFSTLASFRGYMGLRHDLFSLKAQDIPSLQFDNLEDKWVFMRAEYVFDNTLELFSNIRTGVRMKLFLEHQRMIDEPKTYMNIIGADIRTYKRVHKLIILANRLAVGQSFSPDNILFVLGGVDNWIGAQRDNTTPVSQDMRYQYQALVTQMRGHKQNVSNGNKYIVFNSELRLPIIKYLNIPVKSKFIRNFQLVGFADIGAAWVGWSPFSEENSLRTVYFGVTPGLDPAPIRVTEKYYKDPIMKGFGTGMRSTLFGYFFKFDIGWALEGSKWSKPKAMISLILDF